MLLYGQRDVKYYSSWMNVLFGICVDFHTLDILTAEQRDVIINSWSHILLLRRTKLRKTAISSLLPCRCKKAMARHAQLHLTFILLCFALAFCHSWLSSQLKQIRKRMINFILNIALRLQVRRKTVHCSEMFTRHMPN